MIAIPDKICSHIKELLEFLKARPMLRIAFDYSMYADGIQCMECGLHYYAEFPEWIEADKEMKDTALKWVYA